MNGCENIVADHLLVDENGVLIVIALPCHKADEGIFTESHLAVACGGAVGDDIVRLDMLTLRNHRALVDAGTLVGAEELDYFIFVDLARLGGDLHAVGVNLSDGAGTLAKHANARIHRRLIFHARSDNRRIGFKKRNCLALHVGAHEGTVGIVVFKEGNHRCSHRNNHLRRNVHKFGHFPFDLDKLVSSAGRNLCAGKASVLVQRLVGLGNDKIVFLVGGHVNHLVKHDAGLLVYPAVGSLYKAVFVDSGKGGKVGYKSDVRSFRGLYRTHTAVMGVVNVSHLESGAVTGESAGAESRKAALMCKLCQGVGLIHKLGQGRRAEELADGRNHRADVDKAYGGDRLGVLSLNAHFLTDNALHAGDTDAELILKQLAHRTDAAVSEMVDVVDSTDIVGKT